MKNFTLKENEKLTAEIIDGCAVFTIEEKKKEFKGKLMEEEPVFEDGSYYEVVLDSNPDIAYWNGYFFEMIGKNSELQPEEFESISANRIKLGK